jgi:serine/threonine protein kinase
MIVQLLDHRYQIVSVLAKGGFGQTYLARDIRRPGQPLCVVKQLLSPTQDAKTLETMHRLFNSEAEMLERLGTHDQIPRLLAHFEEGRELYLVQDYVAGVSLEQELQSGQVWSEAQILQFLDGLLQVLAFVHQQGVIHRDIKPANIIRRKADDKFVLIDFGAVKELTTTLIRTNPQTISVGTPLYMPIEQFKGYPQFNSDLYAIGVVAIQAATGLGVDELASMLDPNNPSYQTRNWRQHIKLSPQLVALLNKLTHPDYQQRYQNVGEVQADLQRISVSQSIAPPTVIDQPQLDQTQSPIDKQVLSDFRTITAPSTPPPTDFSKTPIAVSSRYLQAQPPAAFNFLKTAGWSIIGLTAAGLAAITLIGPYRAFNLARSSGTAVTLSRVEFEPVLACQELSIGRCSRDRSVFNQNAAAIQFQTRVKNVPANSKFTVKLRSRSSQTQFTEQILPTQTVKEMGGYQVWAVAARPPEGWKPGRYQTIISVEQNYRFRSYRRNFTISNSAP